MKTTTEEQKDYVLTNRFTGQSWRYAAALAGARPLGSTNYGRPMSAMEAESFADFEARGVSRGLGGSGQMEYRIEPAA